MSYLNIPEITEAENLISVSSDPDGRTFHVGIAVGETAIRLQQHAIDGRGLPLVVLALDTAMWALDDVYVSDASFSSDAQVASFSFQASAVRVV